MRFCLLLVLLSASCFAMEAGESRIPHDIESKFINFCQIIQQRDIIYEFNKQEAVQGKVFTPKESFQLSRHIKSGGTYRYDDKSIDLVFQIPYSIEKIAGSPTLLCRYEKGKGNNTLNFFLKGLGRYCGIIEGYDNWKKSEIREFANNILAILERDSIVLHQKSHDIVTPALQIGALVFTSERLRSEKSLLLAYIEFLKLKGNPSPERLKKMFLGERPSLRFPKGQDCVFFASIPELLSEFSDLYTVYKTEKPGEFFDDVIWKLWKLHEVHWDFAQVLDGFASFPINPYVSYMIVPLINSSPKSLYRKLFNKDKTPVELIKTTLIQIPSMEYCQFIFAAAPQMFIQHLLTNNNLDMS